MSDDLITMRMSELRADIAEAVAEVIGPKKTDLERARDFFASIGVEVEDRDPEHRLRTDRPGHTVLSLDLGGYDSFVAWLEFDENGKFIPRGDSSDTGIWE